MSFIWQQHYDPGTPKNLIIPDKQLDTFLNDAVEKYPDNTALIYFDRKITFRELDSLANQFASALQRDGFEAGERISLYMPNCPQFPIAFFGALRAGGIVVPTNPLYVGREIEHQIHDSGATYMVALSLLYNRVKSIRHNLNLKKVIVTSIKEYFPFHTKALFTLFRENKPDLNKETHRVDISKDADTVWFQDFLKQGFGHPAPVNRTPDDTAILMYTGGTTGVPKGAELTHRNLVANAMQGGSMVTDAVPGKSILMTALPLSHIYAMTVCQNFSVSNGIAQVLIPNARDLHDVMKNIQKHKVEYFPGVPTLYVAINNHPDVKSGKYDLTSIKGCMSGAAGLPPEVKKEFDAITGGSLVEGYGLSECSPIVSVNPFSSGGRAGHIGVPVPETEIKLVDIDTATERVPQGEPGELCVKGPQVMKGYWNMPEETTKVLRTDENGDVWLHTGDIAVMSDDGYFKIVDRKKEMIIAGGFNIYPNEVEHVLYQHPNIMEAAVIGVPDKSRGEVVKAFIVLKDPANPVSAEEIRTWCKQEMRSYMVPKYIEFREDLPKSMVGKILRRVLVDEERKKAEKA